MGFQRINELSLRQRLLFLTLVTSGFGVLLGCIGFLAYDMHAARQQKVEELQSTGDLIGMNSTAALEFGDEIAGAKLLQSLSTRPTSVQPSFTGQMRAHRSPGSSSGSSARNSITCWMK